MLRVGLTGGIASGKSTVSAIFQNAGAIVVDADQIARQVVAPGLPALSAIKDLFGDAVVAQDGTLDRGVLGEMVFNDSHRRRQLEAIVHPHVRSAMDAELKRLEQSTPQAVVIVDIPLLLETGMTDGLAEIVVVYTPRKLQLQRLMQRDGLNRHQAQIRIDAQMDIEEKCRLATHIIDNSGDLDATRKQTMDLYRDLSKRAAAGSPR